MTGYATASARRQATAVNVTVKSVNHRFLDLHLRVPAELEHLDPKLRRAVREHLTRGHVDLTVVLEREGGLEARFDRGLVAAYREAFNQLRSEFGVSAEADLNAVLKIPGVISYMPRALTQDAAADIEALVFEAVAKALEHLDAMRAEEARSIAGDLAARLQSIQRAAGQLEELRAGAQQYYHTRLRERLAELLADSLPPERLAQEAALLAERSDISEELLRLNSHVSQFQSVIDGRTAGEAGKRLDFLLQEMGREANTILSKTSGLGDAGLKITSGGLSIKAEIEKLREQVQNLQ